MRRYRNTLYSAQTFMPLAYKAGAGRGLAGAMEARFTVAAPTLN